MYRRILLAYDGSREGQAALRQGAELGLLCRAGVHLLAVVDLPAGVILAEATAPSDHPENERSHLQGLLEEGARRLREKGLTATTSVAFGTPAVEISRVAREIGADLIVIGHREHNALVRWLRGSTGAAILNLAPCSILVAKPRDEAAGPAG